MADGVSIKGLKPLIRDLGRVAPELRREMRGLFRDVGDSVVEVARRNAQSFRRTGRFEQSIHAESIYAGVALVSRLPQANVLEWGGTIAPRGVPIHFEQRLPVHHAIDERTGDIAERLGDVFDRLTHSNGFTG